MCKSRKWYPLDICSYISSDEYIVWLSSEDYSHHLYNPEGYEIGCWRCSTIHEQNPKDHIEYRSYLFYLCERTIEWCEDIKPHYADCNRCCKCRHLIFKYYKEHKGICDLVWIDRNFEDICVYEEEMT